MASRILAADIPDFNSLIRCPLDRTLLLSRNGDIWREIPPAEITPRDAEAMRLRAEGVPFHEIASRLGYAHAASVFKRLRAINRPTVFQRIRPWKTGRCGHLAIQINGRNGPKIGVHRLVLMTFVGPCPEEMEACHNNGDASDNRVENLRWDTHTENVRDRDRHGTSNDGERNGQSRLKTPDVIAIRKLVAGGMSQGEVSRRLGLHSSHVCLIVNRKRWRKVP